MSDERIPCECCKNYHLDNIFHLYEDSEGNEICDKCIKAYYVKCSECSEYHLKHNTEYDNNNNPVCSGCIEDNYTECSGCGKLFHNDEIYNHNNEVYCENCESENFYYCECCENHISVDINHYYVNDELICEDCKGLHYHTCYNCDDIVSPNHVYYLNDEIYCEGCFQDIARYCENCNEDIHQNDYCYDCGSCNDCCSCSCNNGRIKNYTYKPAPIFYNCNEKDKNYFGIEIEVEEKNQGNKNNCVENLSNYDFLYMKHDASINDGFEIVTHPLSLDYVKKHLPNILEITREDMKGYYAKSCGIHIHIPKKDVSNLQIAKMLLFFKTNQDFILKISQRNSLDGLNQWSSIEENNKLIYINAKNKNNFKRYTAINLLNNNTIEFRIFQSNLKESHFMKNIEFILALKHYVKVTSINNLTEQSFTQFIESDKKTYSNLIKFIKGS